MDRQDWIEKIAEAYAEAFGYESGIAIVIMLDGTIAGPQSQGEGYYCKSHGMNESCEHCTPIYSTHGWSATDISHIYETRETKSGREIYKKGFVYDREAEMWTKNVVDSFTDDISGWAKEEVDQLLSNLRETAEEED